MPLRRSGSPAQSSNFTPCLDPPSAVPSTVDYQCNNNAGDTSSSHTTESLLPGESIHIKPVHGKIETEHVPYIVSILCMFDIRRFSCQTNIRPEN